MIQLEKYLVSLMENNFIVSMFNKKLTLVIIVFIISGCSVLAVNKFDALYGSPVPQSRVVASLESGEVDFWSEVKPIVDNRCVVCHGCYDAPCQLKLTAIEGLDRGAHKTSVYNTSRLTPAQPTRLFDDADTTSKWRDRGFFPVLNERNQTRVANMQASVMYQLLSMKEAHPLPKTDVLGDDFTFGVSRKESCPRPEEVEKYKKDHPLWGMPYALPGLAEHEQKIIKEWLVQGATYSAPSMRSKSYADDIVKWEEFLNQNSLKSKLVSRYIYEHLFLANLYFEELETSDQISFFKLIRSSTPPGQVVNRISTRRPYDDPKVDKVYYRLVPVYETIVAKNHMPYVLNEKRMKRWETLFFTEAYEVNVLPGYQAHQAANPFDSFAQLPMKSRYKFMLDEAQFTIMNYIKGPVCRGSVALNVINDHFWVFFLDPDLSISDDIEEVTFTYKKDLELPSAVGDSYVPLLPWRKYAANERRNRQRRDTFMTEHFASGDVSLDYNLIWDGDGVNENAALTIFRHWDSASVEKGLVGDDPKTAWVISYPLLERIHYLLVAGYDVYGNLGHNLLSRLHMDFLRMEGESGFLMLLPQETRVKERNHWYRSASKETLRFLSNPEFEKLVEPNIEYKTENPKKELYGYLKKYLGDSLTKAHNIETINDSVIAEELARLATFSGASTALLPEVSMLEIFNSHSNESKYATIIRNNGHLNMTSLLRESRKLLPSENTITVVNGFLGAYPNAFLRVEKSRLTQFVDQMVALESQEDYQMLLNNFGVRRTNTQFWDHSDHLHQSMRAILGADFGLLDYNRLENR